MSKKFKTLYRSVYISYGPEEDRVSEVYKIDKDADVAQAKTSIEEEFSDREDLSVRIL